MNKDQSPPPPLLLPRGTLPVPVTTHALNCEFLLRVSQEPCEFGPFQIPLGIGTWLEVKTCLDVSAGELFWLIAKESLCWPCQARKVSQQIDEAEGAQKL